MQQWAYTKNINRLDWKAVHVYAYCEFCAENFIILGGMWHLHIIFVKGDDNVK